MQQISKTKYRDIIRTARELFWKHGFRRVSVEEICEKASVSKMTFYRFFPNKIELAKLIFNDVTHEASEKFSQIMEDDTSVQEKIKNMMLLKIEGTNDISKEFMHDFYFGSQPELKEYVEQITRNTWNDIINEFKKAQKKGWFRSDFKPEVLFQITSKMIEIMKDDKILALYNTPQDIILEFANMIVYGILPHD